MSAGGPALDRLWAGWRSSYIQAAERPPSERHATERPPTERLATEPLPTHDVSCVFCRILGSGLPDTETHVVWRHPAGRAVGLLNAFPYGSGHLMVMPTRHTSELDTLEEPEAADIWAGVRQAAGAVRAAYRPDGINIGANLGEASGAGIPGHLHIHVLPRWRGDTNFMTAVAETRVLPETLSTTDERLRAAWPSV